MSIIDFKNVYFKYPGSEKPALDNINLSVMEGEFLAVMGENNAGKSTFCKLINGLIPHFSGGYLSGTITVDEIKTIESSVPEMALKAGMVLDDPDAQLFTSTVRHEVAFGLENILLSPEEIEKRISHALFNVGLAGFEDRSPSTLSGGEKQRLCIAAVLAMNSKILVLDEPLCRLDPDGAREVMSVLKNLNDKQKITIVMADSNSSMMAEYADRVCILNNGSVKALGSAENILFNKKLLEENGIQPVNELNEISLQVFTRVKEQFDDNNKFSENNLKEHFCNSKTPHKTMCSCAVKIENLSFSYPGGTSIKNINLSIMDNDFVGIIGKNGCGKTTLLKIITGLLRPCSGDIFIRGRNIKNIKISDISREAGFVMQNPDTQLFTDSVFKEAAFALKNMHFSKKEIKKRVLEALDITGLKSLDAYPHSLSRADRTKIVITCVLAMGCKIIILDEVDAGNDYRGSLNIMNIARELHLRGFTIIFVTHNMFLANSYAKRIVRMERNGIFEIS